MHRWHARSTPAAATGAFPTPATGACPTAIPTRAARWVRRHLGNDPGDTSEADRHQLRHRLDDPRHRPGRHRRRSGGVRFYALDNEPNLWNSTHRDVHPHAAQLRRAVDDRTCPTPRRSRRVTPAPRCWAPTPGAGATTSPRRSTPRSGPPASRRRSRRPTAACRCSSGTSQQVVRQRRPTAARGWSTTSTSTTTRRATACRPPTAAHDAPARTPSAPALRAARAQGALRPRAGSRESWIGAAGEPPMQVVPRMRALIAARCPGIGLAVTEYSWGATTARPRALAQAEALAIFGREGVDLATRWVAPASGTRSEDAFRFFLDYDLNAANGFQQVMRRQRPRGAHGGHARRRRRLRGARAGRRRRRSSSCCSSITRRRRPTPR